jgi:hypothetical protein
VRERYSLTFAPGEVRVCAAAHGINAHDQLGAPAPTNSPEALRSLLRAWKVADDGASSRGGAAIRFATTHHLLLAKAFIIGLSTFV